MRREPAAAFVLIAAIGWPAAVGPQTAAPPRRNILIFIADGLRHDSVTERDTPALWAIRTNGVHFANSYAVFPTFTMANASTIATGHLLGDTGIAGNVLWPKFASFDTGLFGLDPGTPLPFIENDQVLADLDGHFGGSPLGEETLLALARAHGYHTAAVGKLGPTALLDVAAIAPTGFGFPADPPTIIVDDATGTPAGPPLSGRVQAELQGESLWTEAPSRSNGFGATSAFNNGNAGDRTRPGTLAANTVQQQWFADVTTRVLLPSFAAEPARPFALMFWSRDPDGTQHNHGDSLGTLKPGINGPTSRLGVQNADRALQQILAWLDAHPPVKANTDIVVTSDHGFATISRRHLDRNGRVTTAESAKYEYVDAAGRVDTAAGTLPYGCLAIDLALAMQTNLFDPDQRQSGGPFKRLPLDRAAARWEHPVRGNGLLGAEVLKPDGSDARVMVAANGGADLIYVPANDAAVVQQVVDRVLTFDYVDGVFVDDTFGSIAGTLPLSAIRLTGGAKLPRPAMVVTFKSFFLDPADLLTGIQVADVAQQPGQGHHGGFGRDQTFNNMAAIGPDFKKGFVDVAPAGNADIVQTLAHVLGWKLTPRGTAAGRVVREALTGAAAAAAVPFQEQRSAAANGRQTLLVYQEFGGVRYLHAGCLVSESTPPMSGCPK